MDKRPISLTQRRSQVRVLFRPLEYPQGWECFFKWEVYGDGVMAVSEPVSFVTVTNYDLYLAPASHSWTATGLIRLSIISAVLLQQKDTFVWGRIVEGEEMYL